jgi:hypothetical protein
MTKGHKRTKGIPEIHDELKTRVNLSLTPKAVEGLDALAKELLMSRSELVERVGRGIIPLALQPAAKPIQGTSTRLNQTGEPTVPVHIPLSTILNALAPGGTVMFELPAELIAPSTQANEVVESVEVDRTQVATQPSIEAVNKRPPESKPREKAHIVIQRSEHDFWLVGKDGKNYEITLALSDESVLNELPNEVQEALRTLMGLAGGRLTVNE